MSAPDGRPTRHRHPTEFPPIFAELLAAAERLRAAVARLRLTDLVGLFIKAWVAVWLVGLLFGLLFPILPILHLRRWLLDHPGRRADRPSGHDGLVQFRHWATPRPRGLRRGPSAASVQPPAGFWSTRSIVSLMAVACTAMPKPIR